MTNKQKQCLLSYLGYYVGAIDGIWGSGSRASATAFQKDYGAEANDKNLLAAVNGAISPVKKADSWEDILYFKKSEFKCTCGGKYCNGYPAEIDMDMVKIVDEIRKRIGKPLNVNSGLRCKQHNTNCGGAKASNHMAGNACDLGKPSGVTVDERAAIAEAVIGNTGGIGKYTWGIHVDNRKVKARWDER